jgi:hypothetical protein
MEDIENNINEWNKLFSKYFELENKCYDNINIINELKNNFKNLLGNQEKDDILFYKALIENSHFYILNSLKIRQIKFIKDLNLIYYKIKIISSNDRNKLFNIFSNEKKLDLKDINIIIKEYNELAINITNSRYNNTILKWVKDDKINNLVDIENLIYDILKYHIKLIDFLLEYINIEKQFYLS